MNLVQPIYVSPYQADLLDTDEGNPIEDGAVNVAQILQDHQLHLNVKEVFADDPMIPSVIPSIAIQFVNMNAPIRKTLGGSGCQMVLQMNYNVWYYRAIIENEMENSIVRRKVWDIIQILMEHRRVNRFCQTEMLEITSADVTPRARQENIIDAGRVGILVPHRVCLTENTSIGG